jgi:peptidoglycan/xylan/chitin deacetylase (PgdA/CDA1 family)
MYHGLASGELPATPRRERKYWVAADGFREHLRLARQLGYETALLDAAWAPGGLGIAPLRTAIITFDDGRQSDYDIAYPALLEFGARAEFFVNTATLGLPGFLSWTQARELCRAGMAIQSHSHEHVDLVGLSRPALERQVRESKDRLEDRLGIPVRFFAAPYGRVSRAIVEEALEAGYRAVCTSVSRLARPGTSTIPRLAVYRHTGARALERLLTGHRGVCLLRALRATALAPAGTVLHAVRRRAQAGPAEGHA